MLSAKVRWQLTHWGRVTHICVGKLTIIGSDNDLSPGRRHYVNQCWIIVNWALANIFQWKFNQNTTLFIEENAHENVVCEMASILPRPQCVNESTYCGIVTPYVDLALGQHWFRWWHQAITLTHWGREKWPTFPRRHFQMYFLHWKCLNSDSNVT